MGLEKSNTTFDHDALFIKVLITSEQIPSHSGNILSGELVFVQPMDHTSKKEL